jgi:hypothetical protein
MSASRARSDMDSRATQSQQPPSVINPAPAIFLDDQVILSLDAFVRSIGVRRSAPLAVFLGAGASTSSGIPSAQMCIWEWKRQIFLTNNPGLEVSLPNCPSMAFAGAFSVGWTGSSPIHGKTRRRNTASLFGSAFPFPTTDGHTLLSLFAKPARISAIGCFAILPRPILSAPSGRPISTVLRRAPQRTSNSARLKLASTRKVVSAGRRQKANSFACRAWRLPLRSA